MIGNRIQTIFKLSYQFFQPLIISVKKSSNQNCIKFLIGNETPGDMKLCDKTYNFDSLKNASISPIAQELFKLRGVKNISIDQESISVSKKEDETWEFLSSKAYQVIRNNFERNIAAICEKPQLKEDIDKEFNYTIDDKIEEIIVKDIRPELRAHKGDIKFIDFDQKQGIVLVSLKGACSGCPHARKTLKNIVERFLKDKIPEVKEVRNID